MNQSDKIQEKIDRILRRIQRAVDCNKNYYNPDSIIQITNMHAEVGKLYFEKMKALDEEGEEFDKN